jgi:hypothetical protein
MPKSLKDLFLDKDYRVPFVEKPTKQENILNSELNKNRPLLQFGKNLPRVYGTDLVRIESRGSIDPARTMAVNSSRPADGTGGGFGRLLSNLLGQQGAYRPSDTIFKNKTSAPVSKGTQPVNGDHTALKYAVEEDENYIISQHPAKSNQLNNALNGLLKGNNAQEIAQQVVGKTIGAAQDLITRGINSALTGNRKKVKPKKDKPKNDYDNQTKSSEYIKIPVMEGEYKVPGSELLEKRSEMGITSLNEKIDTLLDDEYLDDMELKELISKHSKSGITNLEFKLDGKSIVLPAALSGEVVELVNAEWNKFQYVGSPFKNYRFNNVERQIRVVFKVYWLNTTQQSYMRAKLSHLRALAFPSRNLLNIKIGQNKYAPLVFTPNIVKFSLGNYYRNMNVIVNSVQIGIPQNISWASTNSEFIDDKSIIYPTSVDVSMDMTIVETHILNKDNTITYQMDEVIDQPDDVYVPEPQEEKPPPAAKPIETPKEKPKKRPRKKKKPSPEPEPEPLKVNFEMPKMIQDNTDKYRPKIRTDGSIYYGGRGSSTG